jgi:hypothetical protein
MSSGNFEIGRDLSIKGFNEYVKPNLEKYKTEIKDIMSYTDGNDKKILVSLVGDSAPSSLETAVQISLREAHIILTEMERKGNENKSAWAYQVKDYEGEKYNVVGLFQENETASKVFQSLALEYSSKNLSYILDKTKENIKGFGERLSNL